MQDLPSLGKAYSMVISEEKQKVNIRSKNVYLDSANSAKTTKKDNNSKEIGRYTKSGKKLNTDYFVTIAIIMAILGPNAGIL